MLNNSNSQGHEITFQMMMDARVWVSQGVLKPGFFSDTDKTGEPESSKGRKKKKAKSKKKKSSDEVPTTTGEPDNDDLPDQLSAKKIVSAEKGQDRAENHGRSSERKSALGQVIEIIQHVAVKKKGREEN